MLNRILSVPLRCTFALACVVAAATPVRAADRALFDNSNRFLDGSVDPSRARLSSSIFLIDSFEDAEAIKKDWSAKGVTIEQGVEHATKDGKSLKVQFPGKKGDGAKDIRTLAYTKGTSGWGNDAAIQVANSFSSQVLYNDEAVIEVFNAESRNVTLLITMGKVFRFDLKPGANRIAMKTREMVDAVYRPTDILSKTTFTTDDAQPATLFFDDFHWVGPGLGENLIKFARVFDCGSSTALPNHVYRPALPLEGTTAYDKERGYGWARPHAQDSIYGTGSTGSTGRQPHHQLIRDFLAAAPGALLVDLPDGKYRVHWCEGQIAMGPWANPACNYDLSVKAGDRVIPIRKGATDFTERLRYMWGRDRIDYLPGEDRWSKYMSSLFYPLECDVDVKGGQLSLEFLTNPPGKATLDFLIIYPVDKAEVIEPEVAALWQDIRYRFNEYCYRPASIEIAKQMNLPGLHEEFLDPAVADKRRSALAALPAAKDGLLVFQREVIDDVFPDTVPAESTITSEIKALASAGEITSLAINLHAVRAMKDVKVELGEFASAAGGKIPASACDLRFVRYDYRMSGQQSHGDWKWMVMPWYLVKRDAIELAAGMSARWWLNVDVPANAKPGQYVAAAKITAPGMPAREAKLILDVSSAKLDPVPSDVEFSTHWTNRMQWVLTPDNGAFFLTRGMADKQLAKRWTDSIVNATNARAEAEFKLMKRYGLNLIYHRVTDELLSSSSKYELPSDLTKIVPVVPLAEAARRSYLAGGMNGLSDLTEAKVQEAKTAGKAPVFFGPPREWKDDQEEAGIYRFTSGLLLWRVGAGGCVYNPWADAWGDPYIPFMGHSGQWGSLCMPASHDWPTLNSTVLLEGIREGITDYRCLRTLERLVNDNAHHPAAADAKAYLAKLRDSIKPTGSDYFVPVGRNSGWDNTWHQRSDTAWKGTGYQAFRQRAIELIAALQAQP